MLKLIFKPQIIPTKGADTPNAAAETKESSAEIMATVAL